MSYLAKFSLSAMYIIVVSVCGGIPHPQDFGTASNRNVDVADGSLGVSQWLWNAFSSLKPSVLEEMNPDSKVYSLHSDLKQAHLNTLKVTKDDHALSIINHKKDGLSGMTFSSSPLVGNEKINPFIRTKRSTCQMPANLTQMVSDLNSRLNASQLVGLNPKQPFRNIIPADQPSQCHNDTTNDWWPRSEVNLRSTCPWNITEHDLGENAFPRYINKAVCLCVSCIGSPAFRCEEITQTVTYFYRQGCQDGLALMDTRNITITVGCHCVAANPQTATSNPGPQLSR